MFISLGFIAYLGNSAYFARPLAPKLPESPNSNYAKLTINLCTLSSTKSSQGMQFFFMKKSDTLCTKQLTTQHIVINSSM